VIDVYTNASTTYNNGSIVRSEIGIISSQSTKINYCKADLSIPDIAQCEHFINKDKALASI
jgi:hypothetical protein